MIKKIKNYSLKFMKKFTYNDTSYLDLYTMTNNKTSKVVFVRFERIVSITKDSIPRLFKLKPNNYTTKVLHIEVLKNYKQFEFDRVVEQSRKGKYTLIIIHEYDGPTLSDIMVKYYEIYYDTGILVDSFNYKEMTINVKELINQYFISFPEIIKLGFKPSIYNTKWDGINLKLFENHLTTNQHYLLGINTEYYEMIIGKKFNISQSQVFFDAIKELSYYDKIVQYYYKLTKTETLTNIATIMGLAKMLGDEEYTTMITSTNLFPFTLGFNILFPPFVPYSDILPLIDQLS